MYPTTAMRLNCKQLNPSKLKKKQSKTNRHTDEVRFSVKPWLQLRFDYDTTTIRRYHDGFGYDGSDRNYDLRSTVMWLRHDTTKNWRVNFLLTSNHAECMKQARAIRRSRIVVVSCAYITIAIRLRYDYDTMIPRRIRLRRKWSNIRFDRDTTIRSDYDVLRAPISIRRDSTRAKNEHVNFCRSRVVVVS